MPDPGITASRDPVTEDPLAAPLVALRGISKRYGAVLANDAIDLAIPRGEIHALLGENGAGKSTLVKILYGAVEPSAGAILWEGRPVRLSSPVAARALGIAMVFQHFSLFEELTVAENVAVAMPPGEGVGAVRARLAALSAEYGLALEPDRLVWTLSAGERQRIEIVRCLMQSPRLLVLDEPTSVLTPQEAERLFATLERLAAEGCTILYISHRLEEVRRLCARATILRGGRVVATIDPRAHAAGAIAAMMVGAEVAALRPHAPAAAGAHPERLTLTALSLPPDGVHGRALVDLSLGVRAGEVVGIAGVAGNGQSELFAALSGERLADAPERVRIGDRACGRLGIEARRRLGAAFVPEERLGHAAVPGQSLVENGLLSHHGVDRGLVRAGLIARGALRRLAGGIIRLFDVRGPGEGARARELSGGNLQKFVVGREIARRPALLVVDQPTWGVDAGAAGLIRQAIVDLAGQGSAVVVISQDLDELFAIADRLAVIHDGRLSQARPLGAWTRERVGLAMMGAAEVPRAA